tara:strand:+ start:25648 stop:26436 length:789 start_codon:yes stop_codon:yes gene_type:complete
MESANEPYIVKKITRFLKPLLLNAHMKHILKKIWNFLWHEDDIATFKGFLSLLANLAIAFIIIKFIFYPGLGFALNTDYPIVGVLSESMEHQLINPCTQYNQFGECVAKDKNQYELCNQKYSNWFYVNYETFWKECGPWYENIDITKSEFENYNLKNGFSKGDMLIIYGSKPENVNPGDIIVFEGNRRYPIIHRVVRKYEEEGNIYYQTKGDHNKDSIKDLSLNEEKIIHNEKTFKGKAIFWIPYLGYVKIIPTEIYKLIIN